MAVDRHALARDLAEETDDLAKMLADLGLAAWDLPTPSAGWSVRDQVSHLAFFDEATLLALRDPGRFKTEAQALMAGGDDFPDRLAANHRTLTILDLRAWFHDRRAELIDVLTSTSTDRRMPWYGPDMSAASAATARLMETWAHGQDIADATGVTRRPTGRLRHVAHLGVRTRGFSYALRGRTAPELEVHVELAAPDGETWAWGPPDAQHRVSGPAEDFCLVVTQRRHLDDTALVAIGDGATEWLGIAQAFAGAPGPGRAPSTSMTH